MLKHLYIRNYALFAETEVHFEKGLNILTGETGAGKSLLVGALGLINGKRADNSVVFRQGEKCVVEASFQSLNARANQLLQSYQDFDFDGGDLIIRREINPSGKSRAFINDTPVGLSVLREVSNLLVDMHSQHENQQLVSHEKQLELLDAFADCQNEVGSFALGLQTAEKLRLEVQQLKARENEANTKLDYLRFQLNELEAAGLQEGEEQSLEDELNLLQNSEEVREALGQATEVLYHQEASLYEQLSEILIPLQKLASVNSQIDEIATGLKDMQEGMKEQAFGLQEMLETVESDPERLAFIEDRLAIYHKLKLKYQANSGAALVEQYQQIKQQLSEFDSLEELIAEKETEYQAQQDKLIRIGLKIEAARVAAKPQLEDRIHKLLRKVGFEKAQFDVRIERNTGTGAVWQVEEESVKPTPQGLNRVSFQIRTNPGMPAGPLSQIASGGEIARVMLAIKSALAEKSEFPVLIFDEIDTGISGEIANKVGQVMLNLGQQFQILAITHLPQIAAKGNYHYQISKQVVAEQTTSEVKRLSHDDRVRELAKMLSGDHPTESAMKNAVELMQAD